MTNVCVAHRAILCGLVLALASTAQCPPPGGYPPPIPPPPTTGGTWTPSNPAAPTAPQPAGPAAPQPAGPAAPQPETPKSGPVTPRTPGPGARMGPRTGGLVIDFERGATSKDRLKVDWVHPVPPARKANETSAAGMLTYEEALAVLWESGDNRPLLVLRECSLCKDGDEALLQRSLNNDRTQLLTKWFRTVRLPSHVTEYGHPFFNVFAHAYKDSWPHFYLLAHPGAQPVTFSGTQTQTQLWKGMVDVLEQRYAKDPNKAVKEWISVLDAYDAIDAKRRQMQEQLDEARANEGPESARAKKLVEGLAKLDAEREATAAREAKVKDLGLLPMPRAATTVGALSPAK